MAILDGISPWWWVALAILLAAAEMVTITTVLVWAAVAALITALALWVAPGLGAFQQIGIFAALSIVFFFVGRALVGRFGQPGGEAVSTLNRRSAQLIGREAVVTRVDGDEGKVTVDGIPWPARLEAGSARPVVGDRVQVVAVDGIVLRVRAT